MPRQSTRIRKNRTEETTMTEAHDDQLTRIMETAGMIYAKAAEDIRDSAWMPQEMAADIAEHIACVNIPGGDTDATADFLDGWVGGCEAVAAAIRAYRPIKTVQE